MSISGRSDFSLQQLLITPITIKGHYPTAALANGLSVSGVSSIGPSWTEKTTTAKSPQKYKFAHIFKINS